MQEVKLPPFATANRWQTELKEIEISRLNDRARSRARAIKIRTGIVAALAGSIVTFVTCCILNGIDKMPAISVNFWSAY